jgi:hypothetical protein
MAQVRLAHRKQEFCAYLCMQLDVLFLVYPVAAGAVSGLMYTRNQTLFVTRSTHAESVDGYKRGTNHPEYDPYKCWVPHLPLTNATTPSVFKYMMPLTFLKKL